MKVMILALTLVIFHGPTGLVIHVNPDKVSALRDPSTFAKGSWAKGTGCLVILGANRVVAVREQCDEVQVQLGKPTPVQQKPGGPPCTMVCGEAPKR